MLACARTSTINGDPMRIDDALDYLRDQVVPALDTMTGSRGLSVLVDRESGRCVVIAGWTTEADLAASRETVAPLRARAQEILGGDPAVEEWTLEVLDMRTIPQPGFCARSTRLELAASDVDSAIDTYRTSALPVLETFEGFCNAALLVDRARGAMISTVFFDSRDAMVATRGRADEIRRSTSDKAHATVLDVHEYDVAIAGLRPPE